MSEFYTLKQATDLAGLSDGVLRVWRSRHPEIAKNPTLNPRRRGGGRANLKLADVIYMAIIGRLSKNGMPAPDAARCADGFLELLQAARLEDIHEIFKRAVLLFVDHDADGHIEARALALPRMSSPGDERRAIAAAVGFEFEHFPTCVKSIVDLNAIYEEAITLTRGK